MSIKAFKGMYEKMLGKDMYFKLLKGLRETNDLYQYEFDKSDIPIDFLITLYNASIDYIV